MSPACQSYCSRMLVVCRLLFFLSSIHYCTSYRCPRMTRTVCNSLRVGHNGGGESRPRETITLRLENPNGTRQSCYNLNTEYQIVMTAPENEIIKGFIMVQDADKLYGKFAAVDQKQIPHVDRDFCKNGMASLTCTSDCGFGREIKFPYISPNSIKKVEFRYSVVFNEYGSYLVNKTTIFRPCWTPPPVKPTTAPPAEPTTPPPPPVVCNASEFKTDHNPTPVEQNCRNDVTYINSTVHKEGDNTFDCKYVDRRKNPRGVKRVDCYTGCEHNKDGRPLCCRVKHEEYVNRTFSCTLRGTSKPAAPQEKILQLLQLRKCECFYCDDVCSVKPSAVSRNSIEYNPQETNKVEKR